MPTNKQRREAARRHLERQLERRQQYDVKRKQRNLIATVAGSIIVVVVIVFAMIWLIGDDKKTPAAAGSTTPAASDSATPTASDTTTAAPQPQTAGPCGYTQSAQPASKNVGFPPDPKPTPTTTRVVTFTTNKGPVTLTLDAANAPCTAQSIAYLVGKKYYDKTSCHRLVTTGIYVLQCGDPTGTGSGGPGYESKDENLDKADYSVVGTVAMANAGAGTDGSQFFIIYKDTSTLPKSYTVIGHITAGMDIVQAVAAGGSDDSNASGDGKPKIALTITKATVAPPVTGSATMVTPSAAAPSETAVPSSTPTGSTAP